MTPIQQILKQARDKRAAGLEPADTAAFGFPQTPLVPEGSFGIPKGPAFGVPQEPLVPKGSFLPPPLEPQSPPPQPPVASGNPPPATTVTSSTTPPTGQQPAPTPQPQPKPQPQPQLAKPAPVTTLTGTTQPPQGNVTVSGTMTQPAAPPSPVSAPTTESPNTQIQPQVQQPASPQPAQPTQPALDPQQIVAKLPKNNNISPEQQQAFASGLTESIKGKETLVNGARDLAAGQNSPAAKEFQTHMQQFEKTWIDDEMKRRAAENPAAVSTPQGWAGTYRQVADQWQQMPQEMKWLTGLGLGGGLLAMAAGIFGEGGMGMGLLGLLGIGGAGLAGAAGGLFGDDARRMLGQGAVGAANLFGAEIPKAETIQSALSGGGDADAIKKVQDAMNAEGGGWAAGQAEIGKSRAGLERLMSLGRHHGSTMLMGLPGEGAPRTAEEAGQMYDQLAAKHKELSDPMFLQNQARQAGIARLQAANKEQGGLFDNMFAARSAPKDWSTAGQRAFNSGFREDQILQHFLQNPELKPFLSTTPDGKYYTLPQGNTYEEFMNNMLTNRYGAYPGIEKPAALNIAEKLAAEFRGLKLARCWAGYEPVPGAKKYSKGSCRPAGSKKTQKEMKNGKESHTEKT